MVFLCAVVMINEFASLSIPYQGSYVILSVVESHLVICSSIHAKHRTKMYLRCVSRVPT